jgi:hypothetical protein
MFRTVCRLASQVSGFRSGHLAGNKAITTPGSPKRMWGKIHFGNVFHGLRNSSMATQRFRGQRFSMKKHRYKKRWKFRRYKLAALAHVPFQKKLRIGMLPRLAAGGASSVNLDEANLEAFSESLQAKVMAKAEAAASQKDSSDSSAASATKGKKHKGIPSSETATTHTRSRVSLVTPGPIRIRTKYSL